MKWLLIAFSPLLLVGCVAASVAPVRHDARDQQGIVVSASWGTPSFGVFVDAKMNVIDLVPTQDNGLAEIAGLQVGDVLLDLRPATELPGISSAPISFVDANAVRDLIEMTSMIQQTYTPTPDTRTFPSLESMKIITYNSSDYAMRNMPQPVPMVLRVQRNEKVIEFVITPGYPSLLSEQSRDVPLPPDTEYF